jgi:hypothetical protein
VPAGARRQVRSQGAQGAQRLGRCPGLQVRRGCCTPRHRCASSRAHPVSAPPYWGRQRGRLNAGNRWLGRKSSCVVRRVWCRQWALVPLSAHIRLVNSARNGQEHERWRAAPQLGGPSRWRGLDVLAPSRRGAARRLRGFHGMVVELFRWRVHAGETSQHAVRRRLRVRKHTISPPVGRAQVFAGHSGAVCCGAFTPDGRSVCTASADGRHGHWWRDVVFLPLRLSSCVFVHAVCDSGTRGQGSACSTFRQAVRYGVSVNGSSQPDATRFLCRVSPSTKARSRPWTFILLAYLPSPDQKMRLRG